MTVTGTFVESPVVSVRLYKNQATRNCHEQVHCFVNGRAGEIGEENQSEAHCRKGQHPLLTVLEKTGNERGTAKQQN